MTKQTIHVEALFDGKLTQYRQTIEIVDGTIHSIKDASDDIKCLSGLLIAGFIDVQVNGGGGFLFNQSPDLITIEKIAKAHQKYGTTGWLPTLVTDVFSKMLLAADAVSEARKKPLLGVLGIHFEGPHLSIEKKGVHSKTLIRKISKEEIELFKRQDLGRVVVTLAPESVSTQHIKELTDAGVIICLGHSNATFEEANASLAAGATGFTHLFNAMSQFTSREPGLVGAALLDKNSYAGIILDGIHVHKDTARLAHQCKDNLMLVTDAMPPVGVDENEFDFFGETILRNGFKLTDTNGRLAGSAIDMMSCVENAAEMLNLSFEKATLLASFKPASFLGLQEQYGCLKTGSKASFILLKNDNLNGNKKVSASWINGSKIF